MFSTVWGIFASDKKKDNGAMKQETRAQHGPHRQPETIDLFHDTDSEEEQANPTEAGRDALSGSPATGEQDSSNKGNNDNPGIDGSMRVGTGESKDDEQQRTDDPRYDPEDETETEDEQQQLGQGNEQQQSEEEGEIVELHGQTSGESNEQEQPGHPPQDQQQQNQNGRGDIVEFQCENPGKPNEQGMATDHREETGQDDTYDADYEADLEDCPVGLQDIEADRSNDDQGSFFGESDDNKNYEPKTNCPDPSGRLWRQRMWRMSKKKSPQASDEASSGSESGSGEEVGFAQDGGDGDFEGGDENDLESNDDDDEDLDAVESSEDHDLKRARNETDKVGVTDLDQHELQTFNPKVAQHLEEHAEKDKKHKRNESPEEELMEPRRKKKKKGNHKRKYIYEISTPTQTELLLHSKLNVPLADFAANSKDLSAPVEGHLELCVNWKSMLIRKKRRRRRGFRHKFPLKLPISIKNIQKPVLIWYDQVEPADEMAENYGYVNRDASKMQHSLAAESRPIFDHSGPPLFSDDTIPADDDYVDDRPQMTEWYPHDPFETVLNDREKELAWLFEESLHCFHNKSDQYLDWKYIWEYASPSLRIELRSFEGVSAEEKYNRLIRWDVDPVSNRMKVVRRFIRGILREGYRRPHMELAVAILRMQQPCGVHTERVYPTPNFAAGNDVTHYTSEHEAALHGIRPKSERKDEDWWWQEEAEAEEKQAEAKDEEAEEGEEEA